MNVKNILKEIMGLEKHNYTTLAEKLGYAHSTAIRNRLSGSKEMRVDTLVKFLTALDCELIIRSRNTTKQEWKITIDDLNIEGNRAQRNLL